ncbi:MAG: endonuclease/exonuclease/phosphatase family protein [Alphaproteobacteria bacterium]
MTIRVFDVMSGVAGERAALGQTARRVLGCAILLLAGATVCALLATLWWPFDLATHFRMHYFVAALVLLALCILWRQYLGGALVLLCGAVHAVWLAPLLLPIGSGSAVGATGRPFRVATVNVSESNTTPGRVLAVIDALQPDILALQETTVWWPEAPASLLEAYPYQAPLAWDLGRSVTLISRFPITAHQMWDGGGLRVQFPVLTVDVDGRPVTVIAVHPSYGIGHVYSDARAAYMANLAEAVRQSPYPVIVVGDFNSTPFSPVFAGLLDATGMRNAAAGFGHFATWPAMLGPFGIPIDNVLVSPEFATEAVATGPATGSDHLPLVVDLRLGASGR